MAIDFQSERAERFCSAMSQSPRARDAELECLAETIAELGVRDCSCIVDLGAGHGYSTISLLRYLSSDGALYAVDNSAQMLQRMPSHHQIRTCVSKLTDLAISDGSSELMISLASFHHILNKNQVLQEVKRVLCPGGYLIVADVHDGTPTQRFFDDVVRSYCFTGHDTDFLSCEWVHLIAERAGMDHVSSTLRDTPWRFNNERDALSFIQQLFFLNLTLAELKGSIEKHFRWFRDPESHRLLLPWGLGYHVLKKRLASPPS